MPTFDTIGDGDTTHTGAWVAELQQVAARLDLRRALEQMRRAHGDAWMTAMLQTQLVEMAEARDDWRAVAERAIAEVDGSA